MRVRYNAMGSLQGNLMKKRMLMFMLATSMLAGMPVNANAKTFDESLQELQESTDKIHDIMNDLNDETDDLTDDDVEDEENVLQSLSVPKFDYVTEGLSENEYYGILKSREKGIPVEYKVYNVNGE